MYERGVQNMVLTKEIGGLTFHYTGHAQRKLYLGVELEFDARNPRRSGEDVAHNVCSILKDAGLKATHTYDGSLNNGREVVTHPATLDVYKELTPAFLKVFRTLTDSGFIDTTNNAGGHIHVSRRVFGKDMETRNANVLRLVKWVYANRDEFRRFSMRDSQYAEYRDYVSNDKYTAINTCHSATIEFRIFSGIKMLPNLLANLELVELIVMTLTTGSVRRLEDFTLGTLIVALKRTHKNAYNHWLSVN
jgi:hypothetical protein